MRTIVKIRFGSHLYGTNTENSDTDYKGIFVPEIRDVILQRVPASIKNDTKIGNEKNTKDDIDCEMYSIHHFMKLLREGQTVALDMLFAPKESIIESSEIWRWMQSCREMFLSKNTKAFTGYCRTQAAKYGIKGSRIGVIKDCLFSLGQICCELGDGWEDVVLDEVINKLPKNEEYTRVYRDERSGCDVYEICGRKFQDNVKILYFKDCLEKILENYGERARQAELNEGIDWKAISHAFRVCYEVKELLSEHKITFPMKQAEFIKKIKLGKLNYKEDRIAEMLENLMKEVDEEASKSSLPESVKPYIFDNIVFSIYQDCDSK